MYKRGFIQSFLPALAMFSLLAYIFWGSMMDLILQEYPVSYYNIFDNLPLGISLGACLFYGLAVWGLGLLGKHSAADLLNGFLLFLLLAAFGYAHIFPYNYGPFVDNASMLPAKPLLGFSPYRIFFDAAMLLGVGAAAFLVFSKKQASFLFLVFFVFYGFQNISTLFKVRASIIHTAEKSTNYTLSSSQSNIILLVFDGICPEIFMHLYNTRYSREEKVWAEDFVLYDNTVAAFPNTYISLAGILGGSDFHSFRTLYQEKTGRLTKEEKRDPNYFVRSASSNLRQRLADSVITRGLDSAKKLYSRDLPLVFVYIYKISPYFIRHFFANGNGWLHVNRVKSLADEREAVFSFKPTDKPAFFFEYWENTHAPWNSSKASIWKAQTDEEITDVFYHNFGGTMNPVLNRLTRDLKAKGCYDTTKIIVASDHGIHRYVRPERFEKYYRNVFGSTAPFDEIGMNRSTLMIKDFGASKPKLQIDSRPMALWDIRLIIEQGFGLAGGSALPPAMPARIFQIYPHNFDKGRFRYLQISNMKTCNLQVLETNIEALQALPAAFIIDKP